MDDRQIFMKLEELVVSKPNDEDVNSGSITLEEWLLELDAFSYSLPDVFRSHELRRIIDLFNEEGGSLRHQHIRYDRIRGFDKITYFVHREFLIYKNKLIPAGEIHIKEEQPFIYHDEVRKIILSATRMIMFVDPYLGGDFVRDYLLFVPDNVEIHLFTNRDKVNKLAAQIRLFQDQSNHENVVIKSFVPPKDKPKATLHDRYLFLDGDRGHHLTSSIKDGARNSDTSIIKINNQFNELYGEYVSKWDDGKEYAEPVE